MVFVTTLTLDVVVLITGMIVKIGIVVIIIVAVRILVVVGAAVVCGTVAIGFVVSETIGDVSKNIVIVFEWVAVEKILKVE